MASGTSPAPVSSSASGKFVEYDQFVEDQLRKTRRQVRSVDLASAVMTMLVGCLVLLLAAAVADHWIFSGGLNFWGRLLFLVALLGGTIYFLATQIVPLVMRRINPVFVAETIERSRPTLKNSLVNFLLLRPHRQGLNEFVFKAVEQQAANDLSKVEVDAAVDRSKLIKIGYLLAAIMALGAIYKVASPKDPLRTVGRVIAPWAEIDAPTRVRMYNIEPGDKEVYRGDKLMVSAEVRGVSADDPVMLFYSTADGQVVDRPINMHLPADDFRYQAQLPPSDAGVQQDLTYWLQSGDYTSKRFNVTVSPAPTIIVDSLDYKYPRYTGLVQRRIEHQGDIKAIEGTEVTIRASTNHDVKSAGIDFDCDDRIDVTMTSNGRHPFATITLGLQRDRITPLHSSYQLVFNTASGQHSTQPIQHQIEVTPDIAPEIKLLAPSEQVVEVPLDGFVQIEVTATDPDFGLQSCKLMASRKHQKVLDQELVKSPPHRGQFSGKFRFEPAKALVKLNAGDELEYWGVAEDVKSPAPNRVETPRRRILILSASRKPNQDQLAQNDQQPRGENDPDKPAGGNNRNDRQQNAPPDAPPNEPNQNSAGQKQDQGENQPGNPQAQNGGNANQANKPQNQRGQQDNSTQKDPGEQQNKPQDSQQQQGNDGQGDNKSDKQGESGKQGGENGQQDQQGGEKGNQKGGADQPVANDGTDDGSIFDKILKHQEKNKEQNEQQGGQQQQGADQQKKNDQGGNQQQQQKPGDQNQKPNDQQQQQQPGGQQKPGDQQGGQRQKPKPNEQNKPGDQKQQGDQQSGGQQQKPGDQNQGGQKPKQGEQGGGQPNEGKQPGDNQKGTPGQPNQGGKQEQTNTNDPAQEHGAKPQPGQQKQDQQPGGQNKPADKTEQGSAPGQQPGQSQKGDDNQQPGGKKADSGDGPSKPSGPNNAPPEKSDQHAQPGDNQQGPAEKGERQPGDQQGKPKGPSPQQQPGQQDKQPGGDQQGRGDQAKGNEHKRGDKPSGEQKPNAQGGDRENSKGQSGAGQSGQDDKGNASPQGANKPRDLKQPSPQGAEQKPNQEPGSPSGSEKQSDSSPGESQGDRSGSGKQGGGQKANKPGTGDAGQNTAADQGAGQSKESGKGDTSGRKGGDQKSSGQTGQAGEGEGNGSSSKPGQTASGGQPSKGAGLPDGGEQAPTGGAQSNSPQLGPKRNDPNHGADEANLEYSRQATNLALNKLKEQMKNGQVDPELLKDLHQSKEDLQLFIDRWQKMQDGAQNSDDGKRELDKALRSLGLRPRDTSLKSNSGRDDQTRGMKESRRTAPPAEYAEQFKAYTQGTSRGEK